MPKPLLLDTNLAVLLVVGLTGDANIARHKRLSKYAVDDFHRLAGIINGSGGLIWCPNVISETSNLLRYVDDPLRTQLAKMLVQILDHSEEKYVASTLAVTDDAHARLGVTDAVLLHLTKQDIALLTDDLELYLTAISRKLDATNYSHLRDI